MRQRQAQGANSLVILRRLCGPRGRCGCEQDASDRPGSAVDSVLEPSPSSAHIPATLRIQGKNLKTDHSPMTQNKMLSSLIFQLSSNKCHLINQIIERETIEWCLPSPFSFLNLVPWMFRGCLRFHDLSHSHAPSTLTALRLPPAQGVRTSPRARQRIFSIGLWSFRRHFRSQ